MKLERILNNYGLDESIKDYIYMENFINNGSPSGFSNINKFGNKFGIDGINGFNIPFDIINKNFIETFRDKPSENILKFTEEFKNNIKFIIHPEEFKKGYYKSIGNIKGYPTASGRTVLIEENNNNFFAKLHYSGVLGRVGREMTQKRVKGAYLISKELNNLKNNNIIDNNFSFLAESYGIITKIYGGKEVGMSFRELKPNNSNNLIIPFFSLFSSDKKNLNDISILTQLCYLKNNPKNFFINGIIELILKSFKTILIDGGLLPENHAQNILLEINEQGDPISIVHRDLYEFYVDKQIRKEKNLNTNNFEKYLDIREDKEIYFKMKSYMFDFKLGEYVLYPLVKDFCKNFEYDEKQIINEIIELFESMYNWKDIFYPYNSFYYFENILNTYKNGKPNFKEGKNPRFRKS